MSMSELSRQIEANRAGLYKALSAKGTPRLETLGKVLHSVGFRLTVEKE